MQIAQALAVAQARGVARLDAQLLLAHLLGRPRAWLLAHDDEELTPEKTATLAAWVARRLQGEPLAYIAGEHEFCGLALHVGPAVLVPRPETELLVEWALECLGESAQASVVDLGTGSGAIALALKHARPHMQVCASDACPEALDVARANGLRHGLEVEWQLGDWWAALAGRRFALAVSNPPYVAGADPHLAALAHEPRMALTPEGDGLAALRRITQGAPQHLLPGAWLLLEHGHDQGPAVRGLLSAAGFLQAHTRPDLAGLPRCSGAVWQSAN